MLNFINNALPTIQIVVSVLLVGSILLQNRGGGLGGAFGGGGASYHTKRGFEKTIFMSTVVLAIFFVAISIIALIIK